MKAINLKVEYLTNPIGIDLTNPRFSWNCEGGVKQEAYQIQVMDENGALIWDSKVIESNRMHLIPFENYAAKSRDKLNWRVRLVENGTAGEWSEAASFEMGLLQASDWKAKWIAGNYTADRKNRYAVDCFKKAVSLSGKPAVKKARIYATACGIYELCINGIKAGESCLAPGYTDYRKRIQYQTIDVTEQVQKAGETLELTAFVANGWFRGSVGAHGLRCQYGTQTKLLLQMEITYEDGITDCIVTDDSWSWSNDGPVCYADNKDGEYVDANKVPSYNQKATVTSYSVLPTASNNVLLKEHEHFSGKISKSPSGKTIVDFEQNLAGRISMRFTAQKGQILRIRFGELLGKDGELLQTNIQCISKKKITPLQEVLYVCREGENCYKNEFSIFGFQFVEIDSADLVFDERDYFKEYYEQAKAAYPNASVKAELSDLQVESIAVYSDIREIGFFESSNALLDKFVHATKWSTKSNSADIPTDCPTRERHGWTGDAQIFFKSASFLFDYAAFSQKYVRDIYDWQKKSGKLPQIVPYAGVDVYMYTMNGSVGWADAGVLIPYYFYKMNGDKHILEEYYDRMKMYAHFMQRRCGKWGGIYAKRTGVTGPYRKFLVNCGQSYDEWAEPQDVKKFHWTDFAAPHPEVQTAYTAHIMHVMGEIAKLTGHEEDLPEYEKYEKGCTMAYQELIKQPGFRLDTDRQARLVRPLVFNLLNEQDTEYARGRLCKAVENYGYRLGTGFLSTPLILDLLADIDADIAYKLLENEQIPGWLSMPKAGATTIWESWEGSNAVGEVASLNHYSKGALCEWLFGSMCGIRVDGENQFTIKPIPGGDFAHAQASYQSVYGLVKSGWKNDNGRYIYEIEIPANTTAKVMLTGREEMVLSAGHYVFDQDVV